jgi:hypothetical protein
MDISKQEAWDILSKWQQEGRHLWMVIGYDGRSKASFTLFGKILELNQEIMKMDATGILESPLGQKTTMEVQLSTSAFSFSDWRELPPDISDWTQKGFEGVLMISLGEDMICGLWAFKLASNENL